MFSAHQLATQCTPEGLLRLGSLVHDRREELGWSRAELARKAKLAPGTLRNLEEALHTPHPDTLIALSKLPELNLSLAELGAVLGLAMVSERDQLSQMLVDLDPKCDTLLLARELMDRLEGTASHIPQTYLYIDPKSAECWCSNVNQASYLAFLLALPLDSVAETIASHTKEDLDVIGLGCGDAREEIRTIQHLRQRTAGKLRLFLLDISPSMLGHAYRAAARSFKNWPDIEIAPAIHGDFHRLQRYRQLLPSEGSSPRRRLVCMFGNTFGNLDNELTFVRESLSEFATGDFFLLGVTQIYASAEHPCQVKAADPRLSGQLHPQLASIDREWFLGLVRSYGRMDSTADLTLYTQLNTHVCPVPGSYAVETIVEVRTPNRPARRISIDYIKRYDSPKLADAMVQYGWVLRESWCRNNWLLHLYERQASASMAAPSGPPER